MVSRYKITNLPVVPAIVSHLIASPHLINKYDLSSLNTISSASSALDPEQKKLLMGLLATRGAFGGESKESRMMNRRVPRSCI